MCLLSEPAAKTVEGGNYFSPELQVGQVYDGTLNKETTIIYQPVYVCVPHDIIKKACVSMKESTDSSKIPVISASKGGEVEIASSRITTV